MNVIASDKVFPKISIAYEVINIKGEIESE